MADWLGLIIALGIGLPLLVLAVWLDQRRRRQLEGDADAPPQRGLAEVDTHAPAYVTQSGIDRLPPPSAGSRESRAPAGTRLGFGHASPDFATHGEQAELADARILMVDGEVTAVRELLAVLATATAEAPLVIVATGFDDAVMATLGANRRALGSHVVAATATEKDLYELGALVGGEVLTVADLKAGYTPSEVLGWAAAWTSNLKETWVDPRKA